MRQTLLATPKMRGFTSLKEKMESVNLGQLEKTTIANEVVTPRTLAKKGLVPSQTHQVKILGEGELSHAIVVKNCVVSKPAAEKITKAGGKIE
jgi:large subunit ribosomal protein L15